jgi:hypothetical protein
MVIISFEVERHISIFISFFMQDFQFINNLALINEKKTRGITFFVVKFFQSFGFKDSFSILQYYLASKIKWLFLRKQPSLHTNNFFEEFSFRKLKNQYLICVATNSIGPINQKLWENITNVYFGLVSFSPTSYDPNFILFWGKEVWSR